MSLEKIYVERAKQEDYIGLSRLITHSMRQTHTGFIDTDYLASLGDDAWMPILTGSKGEFLNLKAVFGNTLLGAALIRTPMPGSDNIGEISALYVHPSYFNMGAGTALINGAVAQMQNCGLTSCVLNVLAKNFHAINFYTHRGFSPLNYVNQKQIGGALYEMRYMHKKI